MACAQDEGWLPVKIGRTHTSRSASAVHLGADSGLPSYALENESLGMSYADRAEGFGVVDHLGNGLLTTDLPVIFFRDGTTVDCGKIARSRGLSASWDHRSIRLAVSDSDSGLTTVIRFSLPDGANYLREAVTLRADRGDLDATKVVLIQSPSDPGTRVVGTVSGSPVAGEHFFFGIEHPMSRASVIDGKAQCWIERKLPIRMGQSVTYSAVIGVAPPGQMRRAFQRYVNRERAHPTRAFLHYNCWYDLGWDDIYNQAECLDRINRFGQELAEKRGVKLSSFLFDDGWDDTNTTWDFDKGFPDGFLPLSQTAAKYGAAPGIWLSPWGGYGDRRNERLAAAKRNGFEVDSQGLALSGPRYFERFRQVCLDLIGQGVNQFKFDGTGSPDKQYPGSAFDSDFDAAISLIRDLRNAKPDLFVNLTTGTWPSPFWTRYADSTWRGGYDHSFAGVGTWRQKWITYRDGETYRNVVQRGPLYPLNSLMLHGIIYAKYAEHLGDDPGDDFRSDVRAYFGTGTQLQEMYITPTLLTVRNWDDLAAAAKWGAKNSDLMRDVHWIGGDPIGLQVYGHAAWDGHRAFIQLRNPSDKPQTFDLDVARALQLPAGVRGGFRARDAYPSAPVVDKPLEMVPGRTTNVSLQPFQVVTWDLEAHR